MDQDLRHDGTIADHLRKVISMHEQDVRRFLDFHVGDRDGTPGERKRRGDVASRCFQAVTTSRTPLDAGQDAPAELDGHLVVRLAFYNRHCASLVMPKLTVR